MAGESSDVRVDPAEAVGACVRMRSSADEMRVGLSECAESVRLAAADPGCAAGDEGRQFMDTVADHLARLFGVGTAAAPADAGPVAAGGPKIASTSEIERCVTGVSTTLEHATTAVAEITRADHAGAAELERALLA